MRLDLLPNTLTGLYFIVIFQGLVYQVSRIEAINKEKQVSLILQLILGGFG